MSTLGFIQALVSIASTLVSYFRDKQMMDAGAAEEALKGLKLSSDAINAAIQTKLDVDKRTSGPDAAGKLQRDDANLYRD